MTTRKRLYKDTLPVRLEMDDEVIWRGTLGDFYASNEDGIDEEERCEIDRAMFREGHYTGGGGAAAEWTLRPGAE